MYLMYFDEIKENSSSFRVMTELTLDRQVKMIYDV